MSRTRMILTLAVLFIMSLFLIGFGNWLWVITDYWYPITRTMNMLPFFSKPYGVLGLVLVICGALVLAVTLGLLFDWYHLLIHKPVEDKLGVQE